MHCDALGRMTAMVFQGTTAVLVNQYALPVANLGAPHAGELASQGLEAAGELVNLAEYGVEIRVKRETGTGVPSAYIDVTSHCGDQGHVGIDFGSVIRQTAVGLLPAWEDEVRSAADRE